MDKHIYRLTDSPCIPEDIVPSGSLRARCPKSIQYGKRVDTNTLTSEPFKDLVAVPFRKRESSAKKVGKGSKVNRPEKGGAITVDARGGARDYKLPHFQPIHGGSDEPVIGT